MCGIAALISDDPSAALPSSLLSAVQRRGPDRSAVVVHRLPSSSSSTLTLAASVLNIRGGGPAALGGLTPQPAGGSLCWNGELYSVVGDESSFPLSGVDSSDTSYVYRRLQALAGRPASSLLSLLSTFVGEFSLLYYDELSCRLYFCRDSVGRRSLLLGVRPSSRSVVVASCSGGVQPGEEEVEEERYTWSEVLPATLFAVDLSASELIVETVGVIECPSTLLHSLPPPSPPPLQAVSLNPPTAPFNSYALRPGLLSASLSFESVLRASVRRRVCPSTTSSRPVQVLFSGGLDSVVLAALVLEERAKAEREVEVECGVGGEGEGEGGDRPGRQPVELVNVSFAADVPLYMSPDRSAALLSYAELLSLYSSPSPSSPPPSSFT
jgi:asparagine synthetase B (glutamine-hydrolysing)